MYQFYGSATDGILTQDIFTCVKLYEQAVLSKCEDRLFLRWTSNYEREFSFIEFKNKLNESAKMESETAEDILKKVEKILGG